MDSPSPGSKSNQDDTKVPDGHAVESILYPPQPTTPKLESRMEGYHIPALEEAIFDISGLKANAPGTPPNSQLRADPSNVRAMDASCQLLSPPLQALLSSGISPALLSFTSRSGTSVNDRYSFSGFQLPSSYSSRPDSGYSSRRGSIGADDGSDSRPVSPDAERAQNALLVQRSMKEMEEQRNTDKAAEEAAKQTVL
jgi:hypothetical protein